MLHPLGRFLLTTLSQVPPSAGSASKEGTSGGKEENGHLRLLWLPLRGCHVRATIAATIRKWVTPGHNRPHGGPRWGVLRVARGRPECGQLPRHPAPASWRRCRKARRPVHSDRQPRLRRRPSGTDGAGRNAGDSWVYRPAQGRPAAQAGELPGRSSGYVKSYVRYLSGTADRVTAIILREKPFVSRNARTALLWSSASNGPIL